MKKTDEKVKNFFSRIVRLSRLSIVQSFSFEKRLEKKPLLSSRALLSVSLYGVF